VKAAAVVCTYGRAALSELLGCVARQTLKLPTLVYVDGADWLTFDDLPELVEVTHAPRQLTLGAVRRSAVACARVAFELGPTDGVLMLDDDDFYTRDHYQTTVDALERAELVHGLLGWTGGLCFGLQVDGGLVELVAGDGGVGQQAQWAFHLAAYDAAGGYLAELERNEDIALSHALGWRRCRPHYHVTHVRRHHVAQVSGRANFDRELVRKLDTLSTTVAPAWSPELEQLEQWCQARTLELLSRPVRR
jgi:hypothetical protein